jgi:hypothetical protein
MFHIDWFWLFILGVSVAGIVSTVVRSNERERTIRAAIEKGVALDPATLEALRTQPGVPAAGSQRFGLMVGSIMTFFIGIGLGLMSVLIHFGDGIIWPLVGVAGLLWCISAGLFVASRLAPGPRNP